MGYVATALAHLQVCLRTPTGNLEANGNSDLTSYTIPQLEAYLKVRASRLQRLSIPNPFSVCLRLLDPLLFDHLVRQVQCSVPLSQNLWQGTHQAANRHWSASNNLDDYLRLHGIIPL
jgi:hypothetical protein